MTWLIYEVSQWSYKETQPIDTEKNKAAESLQFSGTRVPW